MVHYKNKYFQLEPIQPTAIYKKDTITVAEVNEKIYLVSNGRFLLFQELPAKPLKEINIKLPAITPTKHPYKPPKNHPWRRFEAASKKSMVGVKEL